jgi:hypothetical protein
MYVTGEEVSSDVGDISSGAKPGHGTLRCRKAY